MISELFSIGPLSISPFGPMLVLAFFAAFWQLRRNLLAYDIGDDEDASSILFAAGLCGILGGKIYYAALNGDPSLLLDRAGIVWYGGFFGGLLAALWVMRRRKLPVLATVDCSLPALALGYAVGRVGCFLVGDDYGRPTDLPWGMVFKQGIPETNGYQLRQVFGLELPASVADSDWVAVHPTQLYETLIALVIWGVVEPPAGAAAGGRAGDLQRHRPARPGALRRRVPARQGRSLLRCPDPGPGDQPGADRRCRRAGVAPLAGCRRHGGVGTVATPARPPRVLSIAGSDSGAGAGIQADLKTFAAHGTYGTSVVCAVTAQNTLGVDVVHTLPAAMVTAQIDAVVADIGCDAVKIGMLGTAELVRTVAAGISRHRLRPVVLDPVMVATSGDRLLDAEAESALAEELLPLADLVTPNLPEAERLAGLPVSTPAEQLAAAGRSPAGAGGAAQGWPRPRCRGRRLAARRRPGGAFSPPAARQSLDPRHRLHPVGGDRRAAGWRAAAVPGGGRSAGLSSRCHRRGLSGRARPWAGRSLPRWPDDGLDWRGRK